MSAGQYPEMQYEIAGKEAYAQYTPVRFQTNGKKFVAYPDGHYEEVSVPVAPAGVTKESAARATMQQPLTFHFGVAGEPCSYWMSTGEHIVAKGTCRCGKSFILYEQPVIPTL